MPGEQFADPFEFELVIRNYFRGQGWDAETMKKNNPDYDIEMKRKDETAAVQVKDLKTKASLPTVRKFAKFLEENKDRFQKGFFITTNGFFGIRKSLCGRPPRKAIDVGLLRQAKGYCSLAFRAGEYAEEIYRSLDM